MFFKKEQNNELEWTPTFENQYIDYRVQVVDSMLGYDLSLIGPLVLQLRMGVSK